jgi:hypothetical protein
MFLGPDALSATAALRQVARDPDARVAKAAGLALGFIESAETALWFM